MSLRGKLALAFALFAAVPMLAALYPVRRALFEALEAEYAARLDAAARAVEGEYRRLSDAAAAGAADVARSEAAETFARDLASGALAPPDAASRAADWMAQRGLDALSVLDAGGRVVSSGHLPARVGDVDPDLASLVAAVAPGTPVPRLIARASPAGVERVLAMVAWQPIPGTPLRVAAGKALDAGFAQRLAALTGAGISVVPAEGGAPLAASELPESHAGLITRLAGGPRSRLRALPVDAGDTPVARIEVSLATSGLARAELYVVLSFLATILGAAVFASLLGALLARRITRPVEALRDGARRVQGGDLSARVEAKAGGEVGELVAAWNAMTADLSRITERAAAAERVAAWQEVARRLAHEIKNPLTPIAMSVETLREAYERQAPDYREILEESATAIQEEVARLKKIVDEFSRFARLPRPELADVPAEELVQTVLALWPKPPPGIEIERALAPGLPRVRADRDQIAQVLVNLVKNAVEAMPGGGKLTVRAAREGKDVLVAVTDTGPGIAAADLPRVFEPYFTTKEGGTGLGLAIAERIVREHGGRLEVASQPGRGATFTLRLPAV